MPNVPNIPTQTKSFMNTPARDFIFHRNVFKKTVICIISLFYLIQVDFFKYFIILIASY